MNTFNIGDRVTKTSGYAFTGTVRAVFTTEATKLRIVVEMWAYSPPHGWAEPTGMLHIYNYDNLKHVEPGEWDKLFF